jgi:hypothetical protein
MQRWRVRWTVSLLVAVAAAAAAIYLISASPPWPVGVLPKPGVTKANYQRIERGMMLEQVIALLGAPPGDYRTGPVELDLREWDWKFDNMMNAPEWWLGEVRPRVEWWRGDEGTFWVCFLDGREVEKNFTPGKRVRSK